MTVTTATCPGCGAVITLQEIPDKPGRLQGCCGCNNGRPVLEMDAPKIEKRRVKKETEKDEQESSVLDGGNGEDDSGGAVSEVP